VVALKFVYLVRHGDAVPATENPDRPLSAAGCEAVERIARSARERHVEVTAIYHSGILRAQETAAILGKHLAPLLGIEHRPGLLPEDDPAILKAELDMAESPVVLVGHLPYMNRLAGLLVAADPNRIVAAFSPATMVCCSGSGGQWKIAWKLTPTQD
jgi:phosphohistidine phosphatase